MDFQEVEEALLIVKQRREKKSQELDFLHKVDDEQHKGKLIQRIFKECISKVRCHFTSVAPCLFNDNVVFICCR